MEKQMCEWVTASGSSQVVSLWGHHLLYCIAMEAYEQLGHVLNTEEICSQPLWGRQP